MKTDVYPSVFLCGITDHKSNYIDGGDLPEKCGKCGGRVTFGYGLAYGGIGPYVVCLGECDWHAKKLEDPTRD